MTAGRSYLSIGDVLTLLRQEFPDVTISKIRFLESQGLVNPERTPSGYRKFYDHDVERLKWVLSQQREHFLPLKVIKGRLENETAGGDARGSRGAARAGTATRPSAPVSSAVSAPGDGTGRRSDNQTNGRIGNAPVGAGAARSAAEGSSASRGPRAIGVDSRVGEGPGKLPGFDREGDEHRGIGAGGRKAPASPAAGSGGPAASARSGARVSDQRNQTHPSSSQGRGLHAASGGITDPESRRPTGRGTNTVAVEQGRHVQGRSGHPSEGPSRAGAPGEGRSGSPSGTEAASGTRGWLRTASRSLTSVELAAASGLSEQAVAELESYGILSSRLIGGEVHYDESEVAVARFAAEFAQFGIEPRHLRLYKHSAEREAGFVEQLVLPLLKQRNPEARNRATEMVSDLTRLGQGLRDALVQRNLKDLLGG
ncbi:MAG: MerR family transcriptional regulator [Acidimicrobiales bacterium]